MPEPRASRPFMPEYGVLDALDGRGLLPWSWASERLRRGRNYWVATVRPDGRPHAVAIWGVWLDDAFYFSTGRLSRKARNLAENPRCVICTERADEAVIVEGTADLIGDSIALERVAAVYQTKYRSGYPSDSNVYRVQPAFVFGFIEAEDEFSGSANRWNFGGSAA